MLAYRPNAFRPTVSSPTIRRRAPHYSLSQSFDGYFGWSPAIGDAVRLAFHSATAYLGFHVWQKEKGFISAFGLFLALGQAIGAICDAVSLVQRAVGTHPPEVKPPAGVGRGGRNHPIAVLQVTREEVERNPGLLTKLPPGQAVTYPYTVVIDGEGEYLVHSDGTATYYDYRAARWEPPRTII